MATPYEELYERALFKVKDLKLGSMDESERRYVLKRYLDSAVADFNAKCEKDLDDRDELAERTGHGSFSLEEQDLDEGLPVFFSGEPDARDQRDADRRAQGVQASHHGVHL